MTRQTHLAALAYLSADPAANPESLLRKLRKLEKIAHDAATAQCNGEAHKGQPFRPSWDENGNETGDTPWDRFEREILGRVADIFHRQPAGLFFNQDPRGYALKIDPAYAPDGMHADWGQDGILAPGRELGR